MAILLAWLGKELEVRTVRRMVKARTLLRLKVALARQVMTGSGFINDIPTHALNDQEAKQR